MAERAHGPVRATGGHRPPVAYRGVAHRAGNGARLAWVGGLGAALLVSCSRPAPPPAPVSNPAAPVIGPRHAVGAYTLTTTLAVRGSPRFRRPARPAPGMLRLGYQQLALPFSSAASGTQLDATVSVPGYTRAPRGRVGEAAAWWPVPGESLVVHFPTPRSGGFMELKGVFQADTITGEVWYTSPSSGSSYQVGAFRAVKRKR